MSTTKLSTMPYAQATVFANNGYITLISYETPVAYICPEGWLHISGLYSMTTRKHIGAFVKEYANITYQLAKRLFDDKLSYNIHTGEVRP